MIDYKKNLYQLAYGSIAPKNQGWELNTGNGNIIIKGVTESGQLWEHDITNEDFSKFDYVMLNGVRFNRAHESED